MKKSRTRPAIRLPSPSRTLVIIVATILSASSIASLSAQNATENASGKVIDALAGFEPFLDRTWVAVVNEASGARDVARWQPILGGKAIRITHSVAEGAYGGETIVVWDSSSEKILFFYFTNAGFWSRGEFAFEDGGVLLSREKVTGQDNGIEAVEARQDILSDGRLRVRTRMLRKGIWEERNEVFYSEDRDAKLVLPERRSETITPVAKESAAKDSH